MFKTKSLNLVVVSIIVITILAVIAALNLFNKPKSGIVLAQGGSDGNANAAVFQELLADQDLVENTIVSPIDGEVGISAAIGAQSDGSGVEVVPTGAFRHDGFNANGFRHDFDGGFLQSNDATQFSCFMAPTYPPIGSEVTALSAAVLDNDAAQNIGIALRRVSLTSASLTGAQIMAGVVSSGQSATPVELSDITIAGGTEDVTGDFAYFITLCIPPDTSSTIHFYGARLAYLCPPIGESDNVGDALTITSGQTVCGQVSRPGDIDDVYQIQVTANQQVTIQMSGTGGDADLYLYPPGTTDVTTDPFVASSTNFDNNEFIQGTALTGGFWYVDVFSFSGTTNYFVTVTLSGPPPIKTQTFNLTGQTGNRLQK